jgi:cytochrome bd-type quinol oxidase subunit 2
LELAGRHNHQEAPMSDEQSQGKTKIEDKIVQVLTEARVVLPGVQALLGFQFITIWSDSFKDLAQSAKLIHVGALLAIALTTIFLMTPAAYHRLVEDGEATEHFHRFASRMLLLALVPLAFGLSADFFVVVEKVTSSFPIAIILSAATLCAFLGLWFGLTLALRLRKHSFPVGLVQQAG